MLDSKDPIMKHSPLWGNWEIDSFIGEGSYGRVYKAVRRDVGGTYESAVKLISIPRNPSELEDARRTGMDEASICRYFEQLSLRVVQEIRILHELRGNSNIVSYEDHAIYKQENPLQWDILIRMELLEPLTAYLKRGELTEAEIIRLGSDLCNGLAVCESRGIIHRDIKEANVFVNKDGVFKLGDFGIARQLSEHSGSMSMRGTPSYLAPEVYQGTKYDSRVDIYSLGILLYKLLNNNRYPFLPAYPLPITHDDTEQALARRLRGESLPPPENGNAALQAAVLKACAYRPMDRFQSAADLRAALTEPVEKTDVVRLIQSGEPNEQKTNLGPDGETILLEPPKQSKQTRRGNGREFGGQKKWLYVCAITFVAVAALAIALLTNRNAKNGALTKADAQVPGTAWESSQFMRLFAFQEPIRDATFPEKMFYVADVRQSETEDCWIVTAFEPCNILFTQEEVQKILDMGYLEFAVMQHSADYTFDEYGQNSLEAKRYRVITTGNSDVMYLSCCSAEEDYDSKPWPVTDGSFFDGPPHTEQKGIWEGEGYCNYQIRRVGEKFVLRQRAFLNMSSNEYMGMPAIFLGNAYEIKLPYGLDVYQYDNPFAEGDNADSYPEYVVAPMDSNAHLQCLCNDESVAHYTYISAENGVANKVQSPSWHDRRQLEIHYLVWPEHVFGPDSVIDSHSVQLDRAAQEYLAAGKAYTLILQADGTVVWLGSPPAGFNNQLWTNIIQVAGDDGNAAGLRSDGKVIAVGNTSSGECNVNQWIDIKQIDVGFEHIVGVTNAGTVFFAGANNHKRASCTE